jgi:phosphoglycolate phosphatase-like HAD superfamily hydrolase
MKIKAILFDIIGTTVLEKDPNLINSCFENAFRQNNVKVEAAQIKANRGKDKSEIIKNILSQLSYPLHLAKPILDSFIKNVESNLDNFSENDGLREIIGYAKYKNVKTGIGTGLPKKIFEKIFYHFRWEEIHFDYIKAAQEIGKSRPQPDMILDMMKKFNIKNSEFLKVGDTVADIQEGKNANVLTAAIFSGTQEKNEILKANPDFTISSLRDLKDVVK